MSNNKIVTERHASPEEWLALSKKSHDPSGFLQGHFACYDDRDGTRRVLPPKNFSFEVEETTPTTAEAAPSTERSAGAAVLAEIAKATPSAVDAEIVRVFGPATQSSGVSKRSPAARSSADIVAEASRLGEAG